MADDEHDVRSGFPSFVDFEIEIDVKDAESQEYTVSVLRSPSGEARETMKFPFGDVELESRLKDVQIALLRSTGERRLALSTEAKAVQEFGRLLFNSLMTGEIRNFYSQSQILARNDGKGLRVKLRINPPKLASLPWEFLYDSRQAEYICLSRNTPLVRYIDVPMPAQPILSKLPLHVLGMVANPSDQTPLKVSAEKRRVQDALAQLIGMGLVELTWLDGGTWQDLYNAMSSGPWHVFHFIGHGGYDRVRDEGTILFEDPSGGTDYMSATQLARLLADHPTMRLVVMNSCEGARGGKEDIFSSTASILVRRGIPAVLAMQYEISDKAAIAFSTHFYKALAEGAPVDAAVSGARISMSLLMDDTLEWATPVLYMRSQDGVLFHIDSSYKPSLRAKVEEPSREHSEQERVDREKAQTEKRLAAARQHLEQASQTGPKPVEPVRYPVAQPEKKIPQASTLVENPAGKPRTPVPGMLGTGNKFLWIGAGGLLLFFLCACLIFAAVKWIIPPTTTPEPPVIFTDTPSPTFTVQPSIVPDTTVAPTLTPVPDPATLAYVQAIENYWNLYGDRNFNGSWELLSEGFRERNFQNKINKYIAGQTEKYCDVYLTEARVLTLTSQNAYILGKVIYKKGASCEETPALLVHQMLRSGSTWFLDRVLSGVGSDSKCAGATKRLINGGTARVVTQKDPLLVRAIPAATESQYIFDRLPPNTNVPVIDGPVCAKYNEAYFWWWKVRSPAGVEGWVVEGTDSTDQIFIQPVP